jgi:GT2 family glycosyltransferase
LAAVAETFWEHPAAAFVYGDFEVIDANGHTLRRFRSSPYDPARVFTHGCYIFSGAMFLRRELIDRVGPFDNKFQACMDFDFLMRIGDVPAVHIDQVLARFRIRADQKSAAIRSTFLRESHAIRWRAAGRSVRMRALTLVLDVRDAVYLLTHRWRFGRAWSILRRDRRL